MNYKRRYHPLILLLYSSKMLDHEQVSQIPKTTLTYWKDFEHQNYYGADWAKKYIGQFDRIKDVYASSFLFKSMLLMIQTRKGFLSIIKEVQESKKLMRIHANTMVESIDLMRQKTKLKVNSICNLFGISRAWYYKQKQKIVCQLSVKELCFRKHPNQLTKRESGRIEAIVKLPENYGRTLSSLYYENLRKAVISCCRSTFYSYAKAWGYQKPQYEKIPRKSGLKATQVFQWLHVDVTYVPTLHDGMQKVAFIKDNFSKAILHYASTDGKAGSLFIRDLFQETFSKFCLFDYKEDIHILSDKGSENKGFLTNWVDSIQAPPKIQKITAQTDGFQFSNSMSESTHSIYKTEFLRKKVSTNKLEHLKSLRRFVTYYNHERFPVDHFGYTPMEVLNGNIPDKDRFKEQITGARVQRIATNQQFNECYL